ncbi:MAG: hypothetical protein ACE5GQ_05090 [Nitrospinales bacterium]
MENSSDKIEPKENSLQEKYAQLQASFDQLSSEFQTVRENVQKRKRETTTLKILLYTGLLLLLIGFIYSNTSLQQVQLQNLEAHFQTFQNQVNEDLVTVEKSVFEEFQRVKTSLEEMSDRKRSEEALNRREQLLSDTIGKVKKVLAQIDIVDEETGKLIGQLDKDSAELLLAFEQYKTEALSRKGKTLEGKTVEPLIAEPLEESPGPTATPVAEPLIDEPLEEAPGPTATPTAEPLIDESLEEAPGP